MQADPTDILNVRQLRNPQSEIRNRPMSDSQARLILILGMVTLMPIGAYHRYRAHTGEPIDRRQEGWPILLTLRPFAALFLVGLIAFLVKPSSMAWSSLHLPSWARWAGVAVGIAAGLLLTWTFHTLGHNLTDTVVTREKATLVTNGPYRWVRHPFYVSFFLAVLANTLVADSWYLALTGGAVFLAMYARTRIEERNLVARFGREYEEYMNRTGRFLPRFTPRG
jgi:protein-S-isoprenylcysteine O-methyltransferase Ste14